jgi:hypothetical protein
MGLKKFKIQIIRKILLKFNRKNNKIWNKIVGNKKEVEIQQINSKIMIEIMTEIMIDRIIVTIVLTRFQLKV